MNAQEIRGVKLRDCRDMGNVAKKNSDVSARYLLGGAKWLSNRSSRANGIAEDSLMHDGCAWVWSGV